MQMKRTLASLTAGAMLATMAAARGATPVPTGITIPVALIGSVAADGTKAGDLFHFRTTGDIKAGDLMIPAGTIGEGVVGDATTPAHHLSSSNLSLTPRVLHLASGTDVTVALADGSTAKKKSRPRLFPVPFLLGGALVIGTVGSPAKPATLADGTMFSVVTASPELRSARWLLMKT